MRLLTWLRCLWHGHEADDTDRDWIGRALSCARCGATDADMAGWQYTRFLGIDAKRRFAAGARAEMERRARQALDEPDRSDPSRTHP